MTFGPALALAAAAAIILQPLLAASAQAQEAGPALRIELNALQPSQSGCRLTFVATNLLPQDITKAAFEVVLFNKAGMVERLSVFDFQELPASRTRVRQFALAGADCANISRILVNGATACEGTGVDAKACGRIETTTKGDVVFSG